MLAWPVRLLASGRRAGMQSALRSAGRADVPQATSVFTGKLPAGLALLSASMPGRRGGRSPPRWPRTLEEFLARSRTRASG